MRSNNWAGPVLRATSRAEVAFPLQTSTLDQKMVLLSCHMYFTCLSDILSDLLFQKGLFVIFYCMNGQWASQRPEWWQLLALLPRKIFGCIQSFLRASQYMTSIFPKLIIMLYDCADSAKRSVIACKMPLPHRDVMRLTKIMHVKRSELHRRKALSNNVILHL